MSSSFLLLWSCGPVQDFIASARKGRDLWFGSWLLSEVSTAAAVAIDEAGGELILPYAPDISDIKAATFDVPNKVLAEVKVDTPELVGEVAQKASEAAQSRLMKFAEDILNHNDVDERLIDTGSMKRQLSELLETYWAVTPLSDFRQSRKRVEALLAARKVTRSFTSPSYACAGVPKSSLDGQREAVTRRKAGLRLGLNPTERLCGVGVLKRLGHLVAPEDAPGGRIASVTDFALATWLRPVIQHSNVVDIERAKRLRGLVDELQSNLGLASLRGLHTSYRAGPILGGLDAHVFYPERHSEFLDASEDPKAAISALRTFRGHVDSDLEVQLSRDPTPYYAILLADGDKMGTFLDRLDQESTTQVSGALAAFADRARTDVFAPGTLDDPETLLGGQCVYAGGDDVLALAPVDRALELALKLRETFMACMEALPNAVKEQGGDLPTLSVGICVAHHLSPLRDALDGARAAERAAKDAGRNAWAVRVLKRSGAPVSVTGKFGDTSLDRMQKFTQALGRGGDVESLPHNLPYALRDAEITLRREFRIKKTERLPTELELSEVQRIARQKNAEDYLNDFRDIVTQRGLNGLSDNLIVARALAGIGGQ